MATPNRGRPPVVSVLIALLAAPGARRRRGLVVSGGRRAASRRRRRRQARDTWAPPGWAGVGQVGRTPPARGQDLKPRGRYLSTFSLVTVALASVIDAGTSFSTRSLMPLPWAMRRARLMADDAMLGG